MWTFEHTETTTATPRQLWAHYADPTRWPRWDHEVTAVTVDGPMATGTRGTLKPRRGPKSSFIFSDVDPEVCFTDVSRLPLASLTFVHRIEPTETGCRFMHRVSISGPLSPLFARIIGRSLQAELPTAMRTLARLAESSYQPVR